MGLNKEQQCLQSLKTLQSPFHQESGDGALVEAELGGLASQPWPPGEATGPRRPLEMPISSMWNGAPQKYFSQSFPVSFKIQVGLSTTEPQTARSLWDACQMHIPDPLLVQLDSWRSRSCLPSTPGKPCDEAKEHGREFLNQVAN